MRKFTTEELRAFYDNMLDKNVPPLEGDDDLLTYQAIRDFIFNTIVNAPILELDPIEPMEGCPNIELVYIKPQYHPEDVYRYKGTMEELVEDIGNLKYDAFQNFLKLLSDKLLNDSKADAGRGRTKLAKTLEDASGNITDAAEAIKEAWIISEPYMKG